MGTAQRFLLCVVTTAAAASGCGYVRSQVTLGLIEDVAAATARHDDVDLVSQAVPTFLLLLEGLIHNNPSDPDLLLSAAEGYTAYATLVESQDPECARRLYARARRYGLASLTSRRPAVNELIDAPFSEFQAIDAHLRRDDLPYVFWAASAWGAWIGAHLDSMAALADLPRVIHLMEWVLARDESFYGGGPHLFLGVYHGSLPQMLGGRPDRSREHFERALELSERSDLMVLVQMARFYARQVFDRELYVALLEEALSRPVDAVPDLTLRNAAAQRQARVLLDEVDVHF